MYYLMFDHIHQDITHSRMFDFTGDAIQDHHRFGILLLEMRKMACNLSSIHDGDGVELTLDSVFHQECGSLKAA